MNVAIPFRTVINVTKAVEEDGQKYLLGESSGPEFDAEDQFMTKDCVEHMAAQVNKKPIPYLDEHSRKGVPSQLGDVVEATVTSQHHLLTKTLLDPVNPISMMLWEKVKAGKQYGQSVAGHAVKLAKRVVKDKLYKGFDRVRLDHIANTTRPSWQHGLGAMIAKSQDWDEVEWGDMAEYDGDVLFLEELEKALPPRPAGPGKVKADKKAGKKAVVIDSLKKLLALLASFNWKSYREYAATVNRDTIGLGPPPKTGDVSPVGSYDKPPADVYQKSYDEADEGWLEYIEKAKPEEENLESLEDAYGRLYHIVKALPGDREELRRQVEEALGRIDEVTLVVGSQEPQVKAYNEQVVMKSEAAQLEQFLEVSAVGGLDKHLEAVEKSGGQVLRSFDQTDTKGKVVMSRPPPQMQSQSPGTLTDFSQLAKARPQSPEVESEPAQRGSIDPIQLLQKYREEVAKSEAPLQEKRAALERLGEGVIAEMLADLDQSASDEDRAGLVVEKTILPVLERIEERLSDLERQIAVAKSEGGAGPPPEGFLVRKSINPGIRPSRSVKGRKATFDGLVRGDQYGGDE